MDNLYAVGVSIICAIQQRFSDYEGFFEIVNRISDPQRLMEVWFPLVSVVDSAFASQLLLCLAFGRWLTSIMKWIFHEDRPYWWVPDTPYYSLAKRPLLLQTSQTCETGPGSPSGHTASAAMVVLLFYMWITSILNDRRMHFRWLKYVVYPFFSVALVTVTIARIFAAAQFPHQCLFGAFIGTFLTLALCFYISDPYIWQYGYVSKCNPIEVKVCHVFCSICTSMTAVLSYYLMKLEGWDPSWTIKLAYRYCLDPDNIRRSTLPISSLLYSTASLLGWALFVSPAVAKYRYFTKKRSLPAALLFSTLFMCFFKSIDHLFCNLDLRVYYIIQFIVAACKPGIFLRLLPYVSRLHYQCASGCEKFVAGLKMV